MLCAAAALVALAGCPGRRAVESVEWPVMGTVAAFRCRDKSLLDRADGVRRVFRELASLLNAHDPDSELARLAALDDAEILARCDARVRPCYAEAFRWRDATERVFNPRYRGPETMDLGAIAKGFALDVAAEPLDGCDVLLDLGGNLKACGGVWRVGVLGGHDTLVLTNGMACATSGTYYRGQHIKDGRTGGDIAPRAASVTVVHPTSAMAADALSTILFILGREKGEAFLATHAPEARAVWVESL